MNWPNNIRPVCCPKALQALMLAACMLPFNTAAASTTEFAKFQSTINIAGPVERVRQPRCLKLAKSLEESIKASLQSCRARVLGTGSRSRATPEDAMVEAIVMIQFGRYKRAFHLVQAQLIKHSGSAAFIHLGARLAMTMSAYNAEHDKLAEANRLVALARTIEPKHPDILATQARLLELSDKYLEARSMYEEVLALVPEHIFSLLRRSLVDQYLGQPAKALAGLDRAIIAEPKHLKSRRQRAELRYQMGDFAGAIRDLNVYLEGNSHDSEMIAIRLSANRHLGRLAEALADLSNLLAVDNDRYRFILTQKVRSALYLQRAMLLRKQGQRKKAFKDAVQAVQIAEKPTILRMQLFLRRNGYRDLAITGAKSAAMVEALRSCFLSTDCWTDEATNL